MMAPAPPAQADVFNTKIASVPDGSVVDWAISPDGMKVVYSARENLSGGTPNMALFSVSSYGGPSTRLATLVSSSGDEFKIGPRSHKVLYLDQLPGGSVSQKALFGVPIRGGNSTMVSAPGHHVYQFEITPNGERAVFTSAPHDPGGIQINLYSAVLWGGSPQRLNVGAPLPDGGSIGRFALSSFGGGNTRVVYLADQRFNDVFELFSVSSAPGAPPTRLNPDLTPGGDVHGFWVAPRGQYSQRVVYLADQDTDEVRELYSTLVFSGGSSKLNETPDPGLSFPVSFLSFDSAGAWVLYAMTDAAGVGNLYSVYVCGGVPTRASDDFTRTKFFGSAFTPNGQRIVYNADDETTGKPEIFSSWRAGGAPKRISHDIASSTGAGQMQLSPDGGRVLYATKADPWSPVLLWSVTVDGLDRAQINSAATSLFSAKITPHGDTVVWANSNNPTVVDKDLYMAPIEGGAVEKLSHPLPGHSTVGLFEINPARSMVVYDAKEWDYTEEEYRPTELFMSTLTPSNEPPRAFILVSTNGNDTAAGTNWVAAKRTIQAAVDQAEDGDVVLVADGTYGGGTKGTKAASSHTRANVVVITNDIVVSSLNGPGMTEIRAGSSDERGVFMSAGTLEGFTIHSRIESSGYLYPENPDYQGGGAYAVGANIKDCHFSHCGADCGGGVYGGTLTDCLFHTNGSSTGTHHGGGAAYSTLINCVLKGNGALRGAGAAYCTLSNCTVVGNQGGWSGGFGTYSCTNYNSIVRFNYGIGGSPIDEYSNATANYYPASTPISFGSTLPMPANGTGNTTNDPQLVNWGNDDFDLMAGSPCRDTGRTAGAPGQTDFNGDPRIVNGYVDIGACEYQGAGQGDYDGDGMGNGDENVAGTSFLDAGDFFSIGELTYTGMDVIGFDSVTGRVYAVDRADDLLGAVDWFEFTNGIPGTGGLMDIVLDRAAGATSRFFRLRVELAP